MYAVCNLLAKTWQNACVVLKLCLPDGNWFLVVLTTFRLCVFSGLGRLDAVTYIGASGLYDMKKIGEWATQSRLDPNDPKNASIMQLLKVGIRVQYCA